MPSKQVSAAKAYCHTEPRVPPQQEAGERDDELATGFEELPKQNTAQDLNRPDKTAASWHGASVSTPVTRYSWRDCPTMAVAPTVVERARL
jgi:hypothetical protein